MLEGVVIDGLEVAPDEGASIDHVGVLLVQVAGGDQAAFARLYDLISPRVFGLILRVLIDRAQSEEVLQEVFLEVWQSAARYVPQKGQGRSWILTLAHRRAIDRVRASQASSDRDVRVGLRDMNVPGDDVADQVELRIEGRRVAEALATLPDSQREAITLAYFGGYSQSEIAALTGIALGTIKTRMRSGITQLRELLGVTT